MHDLGNNTNEKKGCKIFENAKTIIVVVAKLINVMKSKQYKLNRFVVSSLFIATVMAFSFLLLLPEGNFTFLIKVSCFVLLPVFVSRLILSNYRQGNCSFSLREASKLIDYLIFYLACGIILYALKNNENSQVFKLPIFFDFLNNINKNVLELYLFNLPAILFYVMLSFQSLASNNVSFDRDSEEGPLFKKSWIRFLRRCDSNRNPYPYILQFKTHRIFIIVLIVVNNGYAYCISESSQIPILFIALMVLWFRLGIKRKSLMNNNLFSIRFKGIEASEILSSPLVIANRENTIQKGSRAFRICLRDIVQNLNEDVLPENIEIFDAHLKSHRFFKVSSDNNKTSTDSFDSIYLVHYQSTGIRTFEFEHLVIYYTVDDRKRRCSLSFTVSFEYVGSELLVTKSNILELSDRKSFIRKSSNSNHMRTAVPLSPVHYLNLIEKYYYYRTGTEENNISMDSHDSRKFVVHSGKFGCGKSAYDAINAMELGYTPVPISVWQESFNKETMYLLFNSVRKKSMVKRLAISREMLFPMMVIITAFTGLGSYVVKNYENFSYLVESIRFLQRTSLLIYRTNFFLTKEFFMSIMFILGIIFSFILSPELILYRAINPQFYQEIFLKYINQRVRREKLLLIIEDIDRVDEQKKIREIFRIIASLNGRFSSYQKNIGIISYDEEILAKRLPEGEFEDVIEKIALVGSYTPNLEISGVFLRSYLVEVIGYISTCAKKSNSFFNDNLEVAIPSIDALRNSNIRRVRKIIPELIDVYIDEEKKLNENKRSEDSKEVMKKNCAQIMHKKMSVIISSIDCLPLEQIIKESN